MKLSTKPISSPRRAEKYPPPLMRFLRSSVGSRSRGRSLSSSSRSSPLLFSRKQQKNNPAIETQEPSSPKVTCMGQVRVKRAKQTKSTRPRNPKHHHHCECIRSTFFCHQNGRKKHQLKCFDTSWIKWLTFSHVGFARKSKKINSSEAKFDNTTRSEALEQETEEDDDDEVKVYASTTPITPPKNAFILTRCRSAPYRSSSLASKFWGSPLRSEEETEEKQGKMEENESQSVKTESLCEESDKEASFDQEGEEKNGFFKEFDGENSCSIRERMMKAVKIEELRREVDGNNIRPSILTRCKSEPARVGAAEKLDPEMSLWKKRRLGFT